MVTFDVYSKKKEVTSMTVLYMIYLYYTILAGYVINLVDSDATSASRFIQIVIYAIAGGLLLTHHYKYVIAMKDKDFKAGDVSF